MDLNWREARKREWIVVGLRQGLTYREVARRAGVHRRTVHRWTKAFREEERAEIMRMLKEPVVEKPAPTVEQRALAEAALERRDPETESADTETVVAKVVERAEPKARQIHIDLSGGGQVVISGPLDAETLARVIRAVKPC